MSQLKQNKTVVDFSKGIAPDASLVAFPDGFAKVCDNFIPMPNGTLAARGSLVRNEVSQTVLLADAQPYRAGDYVLHENNINNPLVNTVEYAAVAGAGAVVKGTAYLGADVGRHSITFSGGWLNSGGKVDDSYVTTTLRLPEDFTKLPDVPIWQASVGGGNRVVEIVAGPSLSALPFEGQLRIVAADSAVPGVGLVRPKLIINLRVPLKGPTATQLQLFGITAESTILNNYSGMDLQPTTPPGISINPIKITAATATGQT